MVEQYPGGFEGREAEIEQGGSRSAAALIADVEVSAAAMMAAFDGVPEAAWSNPTRDVGGRERPLADLVARRWQELEVHRIDLGLGISYRDWSDDFVAVWLPYLRAELPGRLPPGADGRPRPASSTSATSWPGSTGASSVPTCPTLPPWAWEAASSTSCPSTPCQPTIAAWPPSTGRTTPVMKAASSEARKRAAWATSQARALVAERNVARPGPSASSLRGRVPWPGRRRRRPWACRSGRA